MEINNQRKYTVDVKPLRNRLMGKGASLAAKAANLSSIPRTHVVEGDNRLLQFVP